MLFAGNLMLAFGIAGSLMSLGAIDFGLIVDSAVIVIENCVSRLSHRRPGASAREVVRQAHAGGAPAGRLRRGDHHAWSTCRSWPCKGSRGRCSGRWR